MAHMVLRQLRQEAQKFEASQDCRFLKIKVKKEAVEGRSENNKKSQHLGDTGRRTTSSRPARTARSTVSKN